MALRRDEKAGDVERRGRPKGEIVAARAAWLNREGKMRRSECAWRKGCGRQASRGILERLSNASFSGEVRKNA
jgi:hypothetical protein